MGHMPIPKGHFYLKSSKTDIHKIYMRFISYGQKVFKATGIDVKKKDWSQKDQRVLSGDPSAAKKNNYLRHLSAKIETQILSHNGTINPTMLREMLDERKAGEDKTLIEIIDEMNNAKLNGNRISKKTYAQNNCEKRSIKKTLDETGYKEIAIKDVTPAIIESLIANSIKAKLKTSTINKHVILIKSAIRYAAEKEYINNDIIIKINRIKSLKNEAAPVSKDGRMIKALTKDELMSLLEYYNSAKNDYKRKIDYFLFSLDACGIRASDVFTLNWNEIDMKERIIRKKITKTRQFLTIPFGNMAAQILSRQKHRPDDDFVFDISTKDKAKDMREKAYKELIRTDKILHAIGEKLNYPFSLTMHVARHTFATMAINSGMNIKYLSSLLGHSSVKTTETAYAEVLEETLKRSMSQATFLTDIQNAFIRKSSKEQSSEHQ